MNRYAIDSAATLAACRGVGSVRLLVFAGLLAATSVQPGCSHGERGRTARERRAVQAPVSVETLEYLRAFSRAQEKCLAAMHSNPPRWGMHKEALDYAEFLNEKAPRVLQIVEQNLPPEEGAKFRETRRSVEANVKAAEEENESEAAEMEGGTLGRLLRHDGKRLAMQVRIESLKLWLQYLPAVLQTEMRAICERTAKD